ncbi:MAG TPA: hypothetical protein VIL30_00940 [Ramlibacter sp.]|jgi:hypothetical protein
MQSISRTKALLAAVLTLGALGAASTAQARTDVHFSIGLPGYGYGYVQPAPVYVQPRPVYVQPQPIYYQPAPVYVQPSAYYGRSYDRRGAWGDADRDGIPNAYDHRFNGRRDHGGRRDADRDGVPNRFDHAPHNPYRY